mgnify:CR=1 FL=1
MLIYNKNLYIDINKLVIQIEKKYTQYKNKYISNFLEQKILMQELYFFIHQGLKNYGNDLSIYQKINIIHILNSLMLLKII